MPITPRFTLSQDETHVIVEIRVPHVRVSVQSVEVVVDGCVLHFASPPYLLLLTFPAEFKTGDESECATYDPSREGGMVTLRLCKKQAGVVWPDLDLTGALVSPKGPGRVGGTGISVVSSSENHTQESQDDTTSRIPAAALPSWKNATRPHYGFLNQYAGMFADLAREGLAQEMLELPEPDKTDANDRRQMRLNVENEKFDPDRYLGDLDVQDDYVFQSATSMVPHWRNDESTARAGSSVDAITEGISTLTTSDGSSDGGSSSTGYFTEAERTQLAAIPYPLLPDTISSHQRDSLMLGLVDELFAYVYDHLLTEGEPTIESSWTVCMLSCTLSWLEDFDVQAGDALENVVVFSSRRALIYPYLRNLDLIRYCWEQVCCIFRKGRRCVIRCLLQTRSILDKSECHYLGNRLYIDHYLAWLQRRVTDEQIMSLASGLNHTLTSKGVEKSSLELDLLEIERLLEVGSDSSSSSDESDDDESDSSNDSEDSASESSNEADIPRLEDQRSLPMERPQQHSEELLDANLGGKVETQSVGALAPVTEDDTAVPADNPLSSQSKVLIQEIE